MKFLSVFVWLTAALLLAGCSAAPDNSPDAPAGSASRPETSGAWGSGIPLTDEQGAVTVEITPLNLEDPGDTLDFQVSLNTHSVDLSMDLMALATLTTDAGVTVQPLKWDAPLGGHHVSGILSFPADSDGTGTLEGASTITLKLVDVDAPERVFVWEKQP